LDGGVRSGRIFSEAAMSLERRPVELVEAGK
jgi:hypothetical protein